MPVDETLWASGVLRGNAMFEVSAAAQIAPPQAKSPMSKAVFMRGILDRFRPRSRGPASSRAGQPLGIACYHTQRQGRVVAKAGKRREGRVRVMAFSESLAGRVRDALADTKGIEEKRMFGGVGFLHWGNMLVG